MPDIYDAIVLGAGAAGLMCAAVAGQRGRRVLVVDHGDEPAKKILISGGGRCNFTNLQTAPDRFLSANPHFARSALARYTAADFVALVDRHGIAWHEKTLGQLFCDGSARQIVEMLMAECRRGRVTFSFGHPITDVDHADGAYRIGFGDQWAQAFSLVIATGGPSIPKMGATGFAYDLARKFGLKIVEPRPALVPLTLGSEEQLFRTLSGIAAPVVVRCGKAAFREAALFTHRGLSGPAILQISSYWRHGTPIAIDFVPERAPGWVGRAKRTTPRISLAKLLAADLPERLAQVLAERTAVDRALHETSDATLTATEQRLRAWSFHPSGTEGYAKAEVTLGGISTAELSSQSMAAKRVPGLYAIGEAVDVTGWLGGYNFQWAWASGVAAGVSL